MAQDPQEYGRGAGQGSADVAVTVREGGASGATELCSRFPSSKMCGRAVDCVVAVTWAGEISGGIRGTSVYRVGVPGGLVGGSRAYQDQFRGFKSHRVHARKDFSCINKTISGKR